ncbi:MAG TPA: hypothetical protein VF679_10300 [Pedobacter sp.]|jgi:hypothetical protein
MIKHFFPIVLLLMLILGCKKQPDCCVVFDTDIRIAVQSTSKADLLDPQLDTFNYDNIDVFDKTGSGYLRVFNTNMAAPKRFHIFLNPTTGKYEMNLGLNLNTIGGVSETLVKFGNHVPDTIRAVIVKNGGITAVSKVTIGSATFEPKNLHTLVKD